MSLKKIVGGLFLLCFAWVYLGQVFPVLVPNDPRLERGVDYSQRVYPEQRRPEQYQAALNPRIAPLPPQQGPALPEYGYYLWPVAGGHITQGIHGNNAIDIGAPAGTYIFAAAAGRVTVATNDNAWNGGYGNHVVIAHNNGTQTSYGHASRVFVSKGDTVAASQPIGIVGSTGHSTGPHLHFEVHGAKNPFGNLTVAQR